MNDLISRQAALDAINELHDKPNAWLDLAVDTLENLPSAEPDSDRYEQGIIEGRVQMRTELLTKLKEMVGEAIWMNI